MKRWLSNLLAKAATYCERKATQWKQYADDLDDIIQYAERKRQQRNK